jgi:hypothetical protein
MSTPDDGGYEADRPQREARARHLLETHPDSPTIVAHAERALRYDLEVVKPSDHHCGAACPLPDWEWR